MHSSPRLPAYSTRPPDSSTQGSYSGWRGPTGIAAKVFRGHSPSGRPAHDECRPTEALVGVGREELTGPVGQRVQELTCNGVQLDVSLLGRGDKPLERFVRT